MRFSHGLSQWFSNTKMAIVSLKHPQCASHKSDITTDMSTKQNNIPWQGYIEVLSHFWKKRFSHSLLQWLLATKMAIIGLNLSQWVPNKSCLGYWQSRVNQTHVGPHRVHMLAHNYSKGIKHIGSQVNIHTCTDTFTHSSQGVGSEDYQDYPGRDPHTVTI